MPSRFVRYPPQGLGERPTEGDLGSWSTVGLDDGCSSVWVEGFQDAKSSLDEDSSDNPVDADKLAPS